MITGELATRGMPIRHRQRNCVTLLLLPKNGRDYLSVVANDYDCNTTGVYTQPEQRTERT